MRRLIVIFGIILMVFAFVVLTVFIIAPSVVSLDDAPFLKGIMQGVACKPNEVLTAKYSTYSTPGTTTRSTYLSCVDSEKHARDVSQDIIKLGAIGYLAPFLAGIFMYSLAKPAKKSAASYVSPVDDRYLADQQARADRLEAKIEAMAKSKGGGRADAPTSNDEGAHVPLAQRLSELKEAYTAGLITEAEYKAKRADLLEES